MKLITRSKLRVTLAGVLAFFILTVRADTFGSGANTFNIGFVPIGNAGNAADTWGYGAVPYNYNMSTYVISQDQITKATASGLTNVTAGPWTGSQPATKMTWYEAAAFVNFLNTTTGHVAAYDLVQIPPDSWGETWSMNLWSPAQAWQAGGQNLYRNKDAYYFLPSENEFHKAAYYDPNANAGAGGYWLYATGSNTIPTAVAGGTAAGTVVYGQLSGQGPANVDNAGGLSPYGTMGQSGNVYEMEESASFGVNDDPSQMRTIDIAAVWSETQLIPSSSGFRVGVVPSLSETFWGFRVASVPEPSAAVLMIGTGFVLLARRRRMSMH